MKASYSFKKSAGKAVLFVLQAAAAFVLVTGFGEISLWGLVEQHIKPIVGTLTVGGLLALVTNYVKYNWS